MDSLKDINSELDDLSFSVEKIHTKYSPIKPRETAAKSNYQNNVNRNYHGPVTKEQKSFSNKN